MPQEFVSARDLSLLDSRKAPESAEEFALPKRQKQPQCQISNSWRSERNWDPTFSTSKTAGIQPIFFAGQLFAAAIWLALGGKGGTA